jgi:hypothetical protein
MTLVPSVKKYLAVLRMLFVSLIRVHILNINDRDGSPVEHVDTQNLLERVAGGKEVERATREPEAFA